MKPCICMLDQLHKLLLHFIVFLEKNKNALRNSRTKRSAPGWLLRTSGHTHNYLANSSLLIWARKNQENNFLRECGYLLRCSHYQEEQPWSTFISPGPLKPEYSGFNISWKFQEMCWEISGKRTNLENTKEKQQTSPENVQKHWKNKKKP